MKYMNKTGIVAMTGLMLGVASCSDFSDYNTAPEDVGNSSYKTLWQNISENPELSDFAKVIKATGFESNLDAPRFFTVFAPINETFNVDSVLQITKTVTDPVTGGEKEVFDTATVVKEFIKNHIVEFNHPINEALKNSTLMSLNTKTHTFSAAGYGDAKFSSLLNLPSNNGVMHMVKGNEGFYTNIYEYLDRVDGCDMFRDYVQQYDIEYIDESNSILGPVIHGEQTYEYIEYAHRNEVVNRLINAGLENEDSSYTVLFPNDEAWQKSYDRISQHYKYLATTSYMDLESLHGKNTTQGSSKNFKATEGKTDVKIGEPEFLTDSLTKSSMMRNLAFSHNNPRNEVLQNGNGTDKDTLYSTNKNYVVSAGSLEDHTQETYKMSNGFVRVVDSIPFQPWDTFEPVIVSRNVGRYLNARTSSDFYTQYQRDQLLEKRDTLFKYVPKFLYERMLGSYVKNDKYFQFISAEVENPAKQPELDFMLNNDVLSTKYHIYVVTVPDEVLTAVEGVEQPAPKPYYISFYLSYTTADNTQKKVQLRLNPDADPSWGPVELNDSKHSIVTIPGYVNVIDLGEFEFPISYYRQKAYPSLMMCHTKTFATPSARNTYHQNLRVAGVYLFPVEADTYFKNKE